MESISPGGVVVAFSGAVLAVLGFALLTALQGDACWFLSASISNCTDPRAFLGFAFYLATAGSAVVVLGVWQMGLGRQRIVTDGSDLTVATGSAVLGLDFLIFSISFVPSAMSATIAYFFGLIGGGLVMGGAVKARAGDRGVSSVQSGLGLPFQRTENPSSLRVFPVMMGLGIVACLVTGWLVTYQIVTPGGGGDYWGFPFAWKSIQSWIGVYRGFQYDWIWFTIDSLIYTAVGYLVLYYAWSSSMRFRVLASRFLQSTKSIGLAEVVVAALFVGNLVYDYLFLYHLWR